MRSPVGGRLSGRQQRGQWSSDAHQAIVIGADRSDRPPSSAPPRRAPRLTSPAGRRSARRGGRARPGPSASARATSTSWVFEARSSHQPSPVLTRTPSVASTFAPSADRRSRTSSTIANLRALVDLEAQLRRRDRLRHRVHDLGQALAARADRLDQPHRGVERVVEAVPAVLEEDVAAHLAGERRAGLLHLRLDQAVAGLPHQRLAAELGDAVEQRLARLDVGDDRRAGLLLAAPVRRGSSAAGRPRSPGPGRRPRRCGRRRRRRRCRSRAACRATSAFRSARLASTVGSGWWLGKVPSTSVKMT